VLTTKFTHRQSAAWGIVTEQRLEAVPDHYVSCLRTISNGDCQKLLTGIIAPRTFQYEHSDCDSEVWLNTVDSINLLTINCDTKKDVWASVAVGRGGRNYLQELRAKFHATAIYVPLHPEVTAVCMWLFTTAVQHSLDIWAGGNFLSVVLEVNTYKSMKNTVLDTCIWHFSRYI